MNGMIGSVHIARLYRCAPLPQTAAKFWPCLGLLEFRAIGTIT